MDWLDKIKKHCKSAKEEVCGFIYFDETIKVVEAKNYSNDKKNVFEVHPLQYLELKRKHKDLIIYHSHLNQTCEPSQRDKESAKTIAVPFLIYDVYYDRYMVYYPSNVNKEEYEKWFA